MNVHAVTIPGVEYNDEGYYPQGEKFVGVFSNAEKAQDAATAAMNAQWTNYYASDAAGGWCEYTQDSLKRLVRIMEVPVQ